MPICWGLFKNWLTGKDPDTGKDWRQEEEMLGWRYGHEFEQAPGVGDGQRSLVCCFPWGHKESDMTEWPNWTEPLRHGAFSFFLKCVRHHAKFWVCKEESCRLALSPKTCSLRIHICNVQDYKLSCAGVHERSEPQEAGTECWVAALWASGVVSSGDLGPLLNISRSYSSSSW